MFHNKSLITKYKNLKQISQKLVDQHPILAYLGSFFLF